MNEGKRKNIFVGGIDNNCTEEILHAAFIPFGDIKEVSIPRDYVANKLKGIAFVEYEDVEDAVAAIENMDGAELLGRVLSCKFAKQVMHNDTQSYGKAIWETEEYIEEAQAKKDSSESTGKIEE